MTFDFAEKMLSLGIGFSGFIFSVVYRCYLNKIKTANQIKNAEQLQLGPELKPHLAELATHSIAYGLVEGIVAPKSKNQTLRSSHDPTVEGVMKETILVEHRSKRIQGYWSDDRHVIRETAERLPFYLYSPDSSGYRVEVRDVQNGAECLDEAMTTTYNNYTPAQESFLQASFNRIFGEVTKGLQETEQMLVVGTGLLGVGEVYLDKQEMILGPPESKAPFILTHLSRRELIRRYEGQAFWYKLFTIIIGSVGAGLIIYLVWKRVRRRREEAEQQRIFDEARAGVLRHHSVSQHTDHELNPEDTCVVCLTNPRELIVLDCGHACLCSQCAGVLHSQQCPICRQIIVRFVPLYRP